MDAVKSLLDKRSIVAEVEKLDPIAPVMGLKANISIVAGVEKLAATCPINDLI